MFHLKKLEISQNDSYFLYTLFLAFGSTGSSVENSIQGILYLLFFIPLLIQYLKINKANYLKECCIFLY